MKKLIAVQDVRKNHAEGIKTIFVNKNVILTPSARDVAAELGIAIKAGEDCMTEPIEVIKKEGKGDAMGLKEEDINAIVKEVIKCLGMVAPKDEIVKECDPSGIRLVRGESVICDAFDTGNPRDKVGIKEILDSKESPNMATGFMTFEKSSFDWTLGYDELDYIIEGDMDIIVNGTTYHGHKGDVFLIPMGTSITFSVPNYCKFFFSTYPANWQELSGEKDKMNREEK